MKTITLSANSIGKYDRCRREYWYYKVLGRRPAAKRAGLVAGTAIHAALQVGNLGGSVEEQDKAIDEVLAANPIDPEDYRSAPYLKDALAAFRLELGTLFVGWTIEEVEAQGTIQLGQVQPLTGPDAGQGVLVLYEYRRDMVGVAPDGLRYVCDYKTSSRLEEAEIRSLANSGQLMGYCYSYQAQNPGRPVHGALPVRIVMRKPSKNGVMFEFPKDQPILFPPERLEEWRRHTLRKVLELLSRDPEDPDDWPLSGQPVGCCRNQFGCCDYLSACVLPPEHRKLWLSTDQFEDCEAEPGGSGQAPTSSPGVPKGDSKLPCSRGDSRLPEPGPEGDSKGPGPTGGLTIDANVA